MMVSAVVRLKRGARGGFMLIYDLLGLGRTWDGCVRTIGASCRC